MLQYLLVICVICVSGCAAPTKNQQLISTSEKNVVEAKKFDRSVKLEVQQYSEPPTLINALKLISNEKNPLMRLDLIKPWISGNETSHHTFPLLTKERQPHIWIKLNWLAANSYGQLSIKKKDSNYLDKAIEHYEKVIEIIQRRKHPLAWANARNDLAETLINFPEGERSKNLEKTIELTEEALQVNTKDEFPEEWAKTQIIRARAYQKRSLGDKTGNLKISAELFEKALNIQTNETLPRDFLANIYEFSLVLLQLKQYQKAFSIINKALEANELELQQHDIQSTEARDLVAQSYSLFANAIWANIQLKEYSAALQIIERSRNRLLRKTFDINNLKNSPKDMLDGYSSIANIFYWLSSLPSDTAVIIPIFSDLGTSVFILKPGLSSIHDTHVINSTNFTRKDLYDLTRGKGDKWGGYFVSYVNLKEKIVQLSKTGIVDLDSQNLLEIKSQYSNWEYSVEAILTEFSNKWLDQTLLRIHQLGIEPGSKLIWILDADTNFLPISSVSFNGKPLLESYIHQILPDIQSAFIAKERIEKLRNHHTTDHISLIVNSIGDLPGTIVESKLISRYFPFKTELIGFQASVENFKKLLQNPPGSYLHFASHATFNFKNPMLSGLVLSGGKIFSLNELSTLHSIQLESVRLIVLSACETSFVDFKMPYESFGVPSVFLQAGAPAVISTLWLVDDIATMLVMDKFYEFHRKFGYEPATALAKAQLWLRSVTYGEIEKILENHWNKNEINTRVKHSILKSGSIKKYDIPFSDRYFWAGFVYTGL